jgi:hypothetical protein
MTGVAKPTPIEAFDLNIADARWLVETARILQNQRVRRMRKELRSKVGVLLKLPITDHNQLDCFESKDLFVVIKPGATITRDHVGNLDPLLRQSVVAACAALESYVGDAACARIGLPIRSPGDLPPRLARIPLTIGDWKLIEDTYQRRRRGLREKILVPAIRELASTAPNQIGILLSMLAVDNWSRKVDEQRGVSRGQTVSQLDELTRRRNRIAHEGDRRGYGRSHIKLAEATSYVDVVESVVHAIECVLAPLPSLSAHE